VTGDASRPRRILAVADGADAEIALQSGLALAAKHDAALEVLACVEAPHDLEIIARLSGQRSDAILNALVERTRTDILARVRQAVPDRRIEPRTAVGKAFLEIIRHVAERDCDFVVKAAEPVAGVQRLLFASTDQHLLRKCPCPVWLQTPSAPVVPKRVLAAVDLDAEDAAEPRTLRRLNERVIDVACGVAHGPEAEVIVLHVWDAAAEGMVWAFSGGSTARISADRYVNEVLGARKRAMDRFMASVRERHADGPRLTARLERGSPERVIEAQARQLGADLVVMGTVARTGLSGVIIGNTAEDIINHLACPVLAVKPEGFESPVL
jgi:nucleotide-binding universal stress UspA family protein